MCLTTVQRYCAACDTLSTVDAKILKKNMTGAMSN